MNHFKKYSLILVLILGSFVSCTGSSDSTDKVDLSGLDWAISLSDREEYALPEVSHSEWETVTLPGNINFHMKGSDGTVWLRKTFDYNSEFIQGNPAIYLGRVYEEDQVYINGVLIGENGGRNVNFGRKRIYPIPHSAIQQGENLIAIRLSSGLSGTAGIMSSPVAIYPVNVAYDKEWKEATQDFIYITFFFFIALFYLLNYIRMKDNKEYLSFSLFAFFYCFYEFSRNDYKFHIIDNFMIFKYLEYSILFFITYLFIRFVEDFLKFPRLSFSKIYLLTSAAFVLLFAIVPNHRFWYAFVGYWDIHLPIALGYTIFLTYKRIREKTIGAYVHILGLFYILYAIIKQILIERGFIYANSSLETAVIFYFFIMTLALRLQFLFIKRNILKRYDQLKEADSLREKVFNHMDLMISDSLRKMHAMILGLLESKDKKANKETINEIESIQNDLTPLMDDIIELSRLEVMEEVPFKASVPFVDFIKEVIPDNSITYSIRVTPDTMVENSLELINSIVIRLIDFPAIKEFTHNDLIITQDLKGNIHFRFLLFHKNPKIAIRLFNEFSTKSHPEDTNTVKWQIIQQIARLLEAKLEYKIIKRKYLRIDLGLNAIPAPVSKLEAVNESNIASSKGEPVTTKTKKDWRDELREIKEKLSKLFKKSK
ncbi:MAG: hypothetical protein JJT78_13220 [Leptospira sp.]|nr:hypothetical protein [Leptospira sp.]